LEISADKEVCQETSDVYAGRFGCLGCGIVESVCTGVLAQRTSNTKAFNSSTFMTGAESRAIEGGVLGAKNEIEWGGLVHVVLCVDSSYEGQGAGDDCCTHDVG